MAKEQATVAHTVTLINGAAAIPSTTELTLSSNGSAFSAFTSCTANGNGEPVTLPRLGLPAYGTLTCVLQRVVTQDDITAGSYAPFTVRALVQDTTAYAPEYKVYGTPADIPALELFTGLPCKQCRGCLAQMFGLVQQHSLLGETDAERIATIFNPICRITRDNTTCSTVTNAIRNNANVGKRAGLICTMLRECQPDRFESTCSLASTTPAIPSGTVDLCKPQGTNRGEAVIPGVGNNLNISTGSCYNATNHRCSADQECITLQDTNAVPSKLCTCSNSTGNDTCVDYYPCVDSPCTKCKNCMASMRAFTQQDTIKNELIPAKVSDAFRSRCVELKFDQDLCSRVAILISDSYQGNLGKRPGWLCQNLGGCPSNITTLPEGCIIGLSGSGLAANITRATFSKCTIDGLSTGSPVPSASIYPNSSSPWPTGTCNATSGPGSCNATLGESCSFASERKFCVCDPVTGTDDCRNMGECVTIDCKKCEDCIRKTVTWIAPRTTVTDAAALAEAWTPHCSGTLGISNSALCGSVKTAILSSFNGNIGKRAGNLCSRLNGKNDHDLVKVQFFWQASASSTSQYDALLSGTQPQQQTDHTCLRPACSVLTSKGMWYQLHPCQ